MNQTWQFLIDDEMPNLMRSDAMYPKTLLPEPSKLCRSCSNLDFGSMGFQFSYNVRDIQQRSEKCDFCRMLWSLCKTLNKTSQDRIRLERYHSTLKIDDMNDPVLSIIPGPGAYVPVTLRRLRRQLCS